MDDKIIEMRLNLLEKKVNDLEKVYEAINALTLNVEKAVTELKYLREDHNKLSTRVDILESKDGKKWNTVITTAITGIVSALIGALMALITKK